MQFQLFSLQGLLGCLAYFFAGIIDSISGGGGLITIPVLILIGIPTHFITGTNQCSAWLGTFAATYKYIKSGKIHLPSALITLPFAMIGSFIGARLNLLFPEKYLQYFMILMIPVIAAFMLINKKLGDEDHIDQLSPRRMAVVSALIGLLLGCYQGFYGPGAGMFFMLAFAAFLKLSLVRSTGNTRFVIAIASVTSVLTYASTGMILWKFAAAATVFNIIGSFIGAELAIRSGSRIIRPITFFVVALLLLKFIFF